MQRELCLVMITRGYGRNLLVIDIVIGMFTRWGLIRG